MARRIPGIDKPDQAIAELGARSLLVCLGLPRHQVVAAATKVSSANRVLAKRAAGAVKQYRAREQEAAGV